LLNEGGLQNKSVDLGIAYRFDMGSFGMLRSRLDGGYLLKLLSTPGGGAKPYDCAGKFGPSCSPATPKYRHRFSTDWDTPFSGLSFGATWRYYGSSKNTLLDPGTPDYVGAATIAANGPPPDAHIASISYLDLRLGYTIDKITARLGVNNVLDKDPPILANICDQFAAPGQPMMIFATQQQEQANGLKSIKMINFANRTVSTYAPFIQSGSLDKYRLGIGGNVIGYTASKLPLMVRTKAIDPTIDEVLLMAPVQ